MFIELVASGTIDCPPAGADPWFMWIRYFVMNGGLEYAPQTKAASAEIPKLLAQAMTAEGRAAAVVLGARALRQPSDTRQAVGVKWLAGVMDPKAIRDAVDNARSRRHNELAYVTRGTDPELWAILKSGVSRHGGGEATLSVNLDALARWSSPLGQGSRMTAVAARTRMTAALVVPLQAL